MKTFSNFQLKDITTFHIPATAEHYVEYESIEELKSILSQIETNKILHKGGGSNLLFTGDFKGYVLHSEIRFIDVVHEDNDSIILNVGSGVEWDEFVQYCVDHSYYGIENMSYIPGEVGASAVQNIGSYGAEVKDVIYKVHTVETGSCTERIFDNDECNYAYRYSIFKGELKGKYIVTSVEYKLSKIKQFNLTYGPLKAIESPSLTLSDVRNEIIRIRTAKLPDPKYIGSVGSFFKNPVVPESKYIELNQSYPGIPHYLVDGNMYKIPAGWLIEHAGLKGYTVGDAKVYEKQCLVIVNNGKATASDVVQLYTHIIDTVRLKYGINLEPEANII